MTLNRSRNTPLVRLKKSPDRETERENFHKRKIMKEHKKLKPYSQKKNEI